MKDRIVLETIKVYFCDEISNCMNIFENSIELVLSNGQKLKIYTEEKA